MAAEMAFAGGFGLELDLVNAPRDKEVSADEILLFAESNSRFIVEVMPEMRKAFEDSMVRVCTGRIGVVTADAHFVVRGVEGVPIVHTTIERLKESWQSTFRW